MIASDDGNLCGPRAASVETIHLHDSLEPRAWTVTSLLLFSEKEAAIPPSSLFLGWGPRGQLPGSFASPGRPRGRPPHENSWLRPQSPGASEMQGLQPRPWCDELGSSEGSRRAAWGLKGKEWNLISTPLLGASPKMLPSLAALARGPKVTSTQNLPRCVTNTWACSHGCTGRVRVSPGPSLREGSGRPNSLGLNRPSTTFLRCGLRYMA